MFGRNFLQGAVLTKVADHTAAGTDAVTSAIVDMKGYQGAVFFTSFGTANSGNTVKIQQDTDAAGGTMADLTGTSVTSGSSDEDVIVEVHQPTERYLRAVVARGASSTCESIWCIRYGATNQLASNSVTGTQAAELHITPAEGTA